MAKRRTLIFITRIKGVYFPASASLRPLLLEWYRKSSLLDQVMKYYICKRGFCSIFHFKFNTATSYILNNPGLHYSLRTYLYWMSGKTLWYMWKSWSILNALYASFLSWQGNSKSWGFVKITSVTGRSRGSSRKGSRAPHVFLETILKCFSFSSAKQERISYVYWCVLLF